MFFGDHKHNQVKNKTNKGSDFLAIHETKRKRGRALVSRQTDQ